MFRIFPLSVNFRPFSKYVTHARISQKIALGYLLSIRVAIVGTSLGLVLGSIAEQQALNKYRAAQQQTHAVHTLDNHVLSLLVHPQNLLAATDDPLWWTYEIGRYRNNEDILNRAVSELQQLGRDSVHINHDLEAAAILTVLPNFVADYTAWSEELWALDELEADRIIEEFATRMASAE